MALCGHRLNIKKQQSTDIGVCSGRDSGEEARLGQSMWEDTVPTFEVMNEMPKIKTKIDYAVALVLSWPPLDKSNTTINQKEVESMKVKGRISRGDATWEEHGRGDIILFWSDI